MAYICLRDQLGGTVDTGGVWKWQGPSAIDVDIDTFGVTNLSVGETLPGGDNPCVDPDTIVGLSPGTYVNAWQYCGSGCDGTECAYLDQVLVAEPCAGGDRVSVHCQTQTVQWGMNSRLPAAACGKDDEGEWVHISGENNAHLSADGDATNDYYIPSEFSGGDHVYEKRTTNSCGEDTALLTISITEAFNAGPAGFTVQMCDFTTAKKGFLLSLLNQALNAAGYPEADAGGRWEVWGFSETGCGGVSTSPIQLKVGGGACASYNGGAILPGGDNPEVEFTCDQGGGVFNGGFSLWYRKPAGNSCGFDRLHCFEVEDCAGTCEASVSITGTCALTANITGTCGSPSYQWERLVGGIWEDIVGETASTYTSTTNETVRVTVICADGCSYVSPSKTVTCAPGCTSSVSISANGCALSSSITGTCVTPAYQWQLWNGTSWGNISGATSSTYNAPGNGLRRLRVTCADGCVYYSSSLNTNKSVTISEQNCLLTANPSGFTSPTYQWQKFDGGWTNIGGATSSTYTATENKEYRVVVTDNGGCSYNSNSLNVSCGGGGGGGCSVSVDMEILPSGNIQATLTGCSNIGNVDWQRSLSGASCAGAGGWTAISNPPSCNGLAVCELAPADGAACYRVFFNCNDGGGCLGSGEIYWTPDCAGSVEIARTDCLFDIRSYKAGDTGDSTGTRVTWTDHMRLVHEVGVQAYENCPSPDTAFEGEDIETVLQEWSTGRYILGGASSLVTNEYIEYVQIYIDDNGTETSHNLDLSAVVYSGQSAAAFSSALMSELDTELAALGLTDGTNYDILTVDCSVNGTGMAVTIHFAARDRQVGEKWAGINMADNELKVNGGGAPRTFTDQATQDSYFSDSPQVVSRTTPCGLQLQITVSNDNSPGQINNGSSDYNVIVKTTNDGVHKKVWNGNNRTCTDLEASVTDCATPDYLWSNGQTTAAIIVKPGDGYFQVEATCADACEYTDDITV